MWITDVKSSNSTVNNKGSILQSQVFSKSISDCSNLKPYRCTVCRSKCHTYCLIFQNNNEKHSLTAQSKPVEGGQIHWTLLLSSACPGSGSVSIISKVSAYINACKTRACLA